MSTDGEYIEQYRKILIKLQQDFMSYVKHHLADFQRMEDLMKQGVLAARDFHDLYRLSHDFAGSAATFGFPDISEKARDLHVTMKAVLDAHADGGQNSPLMLDKLGVFKLALVVALGSETPDIAHSIALPPMPAPAPRGESSDIHIIADGEARVAALAAQMVHFGYGVKVNTNVDALRAAVAGHDLKAVVAFSALSAGETAFLKSVFGDSRDGVAVPFMIVAPSGDFDTRLASARLGAQGFFAPEADALKLIEKIEQVSLKFAAPARYSVMIVDDDQMLSEFYAHALTQAGMSAITVSHPREALELMERHQIDLILIDYSMPDCNGEELAAVIRQHERYVSLPIIFISSYDDLEKALVDTGLGIDDFLVKPFAPDRLLTAVRSRAQRAIELKALMTRDGFTGLLNHSNFNEALGAELSRVRRGKHQASYAMLDLDHFKAVNDTYGHAAGDLVIKTISRMLQQHLRRSDVVGRCGGEEFGVILPECEVHKARDVIEKIRAAFAEAPFVFNKVEFKVTLSAGLVQVHPGNDLDQLIRLADTALYDAKRGGRDRVVISENPQR